MDWKNDPVTKKTKEYIKEMQEKSELPLPKFKGTTKGEASDYIATYSKWMYINIWSVVNGY